MGAVEQKALGAFYTDVDVAVFLTGWALRSGHETALDPSFGGAVFLRTAALRIAQMGGDPTSQVFGVEIDNHVHAAASASLNQEFGLDIHHLVRSDFFDVGLSALGPVDVVVGNPPFIRYQRFAGDARQKARAASSRHGVTLSALSSAWAPFVVHSVGFLKPHGRLAMVVPAEIAHASYARPVMAHLLRSFRTITLLTFKARLFPDLSEDTYLLLAEGKGELPSGKLLWADLDGPASLTQLIVDGQIKDPAVKFLDPERILGSRFRFAEENVPDDVRALYRDLQASGAATPLGALADVGIGYVTGANNYFHLTCAEVEEYQIPLGCLSPAVRRGRDLKGAKFTPEDWLESSRRGERVFLLAVPAGAAVDGGLSRYLQMGERTGIPQVYKCRTRSPWYSVPYVHIPDGFLTYMSGTSPRLVSNEVPAVAPNTLHIVRLLSASGVSAQGLAVLWQSTLARLSSEIEGHSLGGGMLKLEPTEAERVLLPYRLGDSDVATPLTDELDHLCRAGKGSAAVEVADREMLVKGLGLSKNQITKMRQAADLLRERRYVRGSPRESR